MMGTSYDMAYRDELTGLLGRRALNDRLKGLARQYVIAKMDVDHFKKYNDTHGHDIGDEVLKMVARQIGAVGGGGTAYRYGGEEFCVVFAVKTLNTAFHIWKMFAVMCRIIS
jgi:diguanylate cyclase (GGDEF)-like protein